MSTHLLASLRRRRRSGLGAASRCGPEARAPSEQALLKLGASADATAPSLYVGKLASTGKRVTIPLADLAGVMGWILGQTGSGKSACTVGWELQFVRPGLPWRLTHLDLKSESAEWLSQLFFPLMVATWTEPEREQFFDRYRVIDPFDGENLPPMNVLCPTPGVPAGLQAREVTTLISDGLGQHGALGSRMETILRNALLLAFDVGGLSLLEVKAMLENPGYLDGVLRFAHHPDVLSYFCWRFPKEPRDSVSAVLARLDMLLAVPDTARVLAAPSTLDMAEIIEGISLISLGRSPRGATSLARFWMAVYCNALSRAIQSRPTSPGLPPVLCVMDEFWAGLTPELASELDRLLPLARHKNVAIWLINQLPEQLSHVPQTLATLKNSCGLQVIFRQSHDGARAMAHALPTSDHARIPKTAGGPAWETRLETTSETKERLVRGVSRLPQREFYFWPNRFGLDAARLRAPTVDFEGARRALDRVPSTIRDACRRGLRGLTRTGLDTVMEQRRAHISAVAAGTAQTAAPVFGQRPSELRSPEAGQATQPAPIVAKDHLAPIPTAPKTSPALSTSTKPNQTARKGKKVGKQTSLPFLG